LQNRNPKLYQAAADYLDVSPEKIAMVACHVWDLRAAARCGFKTVYVRRPFEMSTDKPMADEDENILHKEFDVVVDSFVELADLFKRD
jgi:FMN phosphatase YigB (HAD superfamily)